MTAGRIRVAVGLVAALIVGCGDDEVALDAALAIDASVPPPDADFCAGAATCDILGQRCCLPGEKCTVVRGEPESPLRIECAPDGAVELDGACTRAESVGEADDCLAGTYCVDLRCMPFCGPGAWCDEGGCLTLHGEPNVCILPCDPLGQNCLPGQGCYVGLDGGICAEEAALAGGPGDACAFANGCVAGLGCLDDGMGGGVCRAYCDYATYPDLPDPVYCQSGEVCAAIIPEIEDIGQCI